MSLRPCRALVGFVLAGAVLAALPASAVAAITPALALDQTAGTSAGSNPALGFHATFSANPSTDSVKDLSLALPAGLLANVNIGGGACLASATPSSSCQVGSGTMSAGGTSTPITLYLVAPPKAADIAGLALTSPASPVNTADVSLGATGMDIAFSTLPSAITDMNFTLTNLRMPTSCPSPAANVTLTANYLDPTPTSTSAPLTVTGCSGLPYAPTLGASITRDATGTGAVLGIAIAQAANESASRSIVVNTANGLSPNLGAVLTCLAGTSCTIGTATATSPLVPSGMLAHGTVTLGGSTGSPTLAITFPAPFPITLTGQVTLTGSGTVTFQNLPDIPLTTLTLNVAGPPGQRAFSTACLPTNVSGTFTAQSGATHATSAPVTFSHCPGPPTVGRSVHGLADGHPDLRFTVTRGKGAPGVAAVAVGVPAGLRFARSAFVSHTTCTTKGRKLCTTTTLIKGLGVTGARAKTVALRHGKLLITVNRPAGSVTITISGPLVTESKALQGQVKKHRAKRLTFTLKVTDASGIATTVPATVRPR